MEETLRPMTGREKWQLVAFVAQREWVLLTTGILLAGAAACFISGPGSTWWHRLGSSAVSILLLVAVGLFLWMRLARDLRDGRVGETVVTAVQRTSERHEGAVIREMVTAKGERFEVSAMAYEDIRPAGRYRLVYTVEQHIALVCEQAR